MKMKYGFFLVILAYAIIGLSASCSGGSGETDAYAERMQEFVQGISEYAKSRNPNFIIIPQNGPELIYNSTDPGEGIRFSYTNAIDGIGIEELFYDAEGKSINDKERLRALQDIKNLGKTVLVSDYTTGSTSYNNSITLNNTKGFIPFPRTSNNYEYEYIPADDPATKNPNNINALSDAKNYLYLISTNQYKNNKQNYLNAINAKNYDVVLIDLFYGNDMLEPGDIAAIRTKPMGGKRLVIAYINVGAAENFRYYWQSGWRRGNPSWIKKAYEGWEGEYWVEFWNPEWINIIEDYMNKIINAGFDGAYLDNVEAYYYLLNND